MDRQPEPTRLPGSLMLLKASIFVCALHAAAPSLEEGELPCGLSEKVVLCLLYRFYSSRLAQSQRRQPPPRCPELSPTALLTSLKSPRHGTALCFFTATAMSLQDRRIQRATWVIPRPTIFSWPTGSRWPVRLMLTPAGPFKKHYSIRLRSSMSLTLKSARPRAPLPGDTRWAESLPPA